MTTSENNTTVDARELIHLARLLIVFGEADALKLCNLLRGIVIELYPDVDVLNRALAYAATAATLPAKPTVKAIAANVYWVTRQLAQSRGLPSVEGARHG